jgi:hypothetical protein
VGARQHRRALCRDYKTALSEVEWAHRLTFNIRPRSWTEFRDYFLEARIAVQRIPAWIEAQIAE